jgi:hypothetical protein
MNILSMGGHILDLDEVRTSSVEASCIRLTFRNEDIVVLHWRDEKERGDVLRAVAARCPCAN